MASIFDWFRRPEPEAKAVTGPGAFAMTYHTPWRSLSRDPNRLMAEGQALFHSNGWVAAAERALSRGFVGMPWHLEDANGDTVDDKSDGPLQALQKLMERPSARGYRSGLWSITFRHLGLSGNAFWYLDQTDALNGTPLQILYINPARMTPATDEGGNVRGWILDHPDNPVVNARNPEVRKGIPLSIEEVIHFTFDEPDWGVWGVGIAESAQRKIELDRLADYHAGGVLGSGGRLSGLVSPKTGVTVQDDQWQQFVRDWRNITSDPDAAKRLQIAKMPLDFTQMTASPKDLQLVDVSKATKEDILALWGVPLSQLGINVTAGLNSDRANADEAVLWQTIKARSERMHEKIQYELLDRFDGLGINVQLVLDYPEFDDSAPLYESASQSINVALTNDERRAILGLEPLEDAELGAAIYVASTLTRIDVEPEPEPAPIIMPPAGGAPPPAATPEEEDVVEGKARLERTATGLRTRTAKEWEPRLQALLSKVLGEQSRYVEGKLGHALRKNDVASWWNLKREDRRIMGALEPAILQLAVDVANRTAQTVGKPGKPKADDFLDRITKVIRSEVGERVTGINETTRDKIQRAVAEGVDRGLSIPEVQHLIEETGAFNDARAEMIARTETALVYNDAALHSYEALDVTHVEAIDGDEDPECADRDGQRYPIEEALSITDHPNGTLDWVPVLAGEKATLDPILVMAESVKAVLERELPNPVITVNVPERQVVVEAPVVNVPEQPAPVVEVKATLPSELRITSMPDRIKRAQVTQDGTITGMVETDG